MKIIAKIIPVIFLFLSGFVIGLYASGVKPVDIHQWFFTILTAILMFSAVLEEMK